MGRSLRAVLSKKKKTGPLRAALPSPSRPTLLQHRPPPHDLLRLALGQRLLLPQLPLQVLHLLLLQPLQLRVVARQDVRQLRELVPQRVPRPLLRCPPGLRRDQDRGHRLGPGPAQGRARGRGRGRGRGQPLDVVQLVLQRLGELPVAVAQDCALLLLVLQHLLLREWPGMYWKRGWGGGG